VALADDLNASTKETEKLNKNEDLETEVNRMWESEDRTCVNYNWSFRNN
jgi:hypothetical protein